MGARGPRPELPHVQAAKGNSAKKAKARMPDPAAIPQPTGKPVIPDHLPDDAKACFEWVITHQDPRTYAAVDTFALSAYATAWARHKYATEMITAHGYVGAGSTGQVKKSAFVEIQSEAAREMMSWGDRLGLDPKARAAMGMLGAPESPKSKFDGLLGGRPN